MKEPNKNNTRQRSSSTNKTKKMMISDVCYFQTKDLKPL